MEKGACGVKTSERQGILVALSFLWSLLEGRRIHKRNVWLLPLEKFPDREDLNLGVLAIDRLIEAGLHGFRPHWPCRIGQRDEHADFGVLAVYDVCQVADHGDIRVLAALH